MSEPTVHIVDDDPDMRDSSRWLFRTVGLRCEVYESAEAFAARFRRDGPACLVLDVRMPGTGGLDLFEGLAARGLQIPTIFITAHADVPMAVRAMKSGAAEFLEKPFNGQDLIEKVQRALRDDAARLDNLTHADSLRRRFAALTAKEREVLALIGEGRPNREIAARLDLTPRAVELRRAGLMKKLGAASLPELLRMAVDFEAKATRA